MRKKFGLIGLLLMFFGFVLPLVGGMIVLAPPAHAAVNTVVIEGNQRVERQTILSYLQFSPSEDPSPAKIDASIKALFATGLFADVRIERRAGSIVITVRENPIINVVHFEGNEEIDSPTLKKEIEAHQDMIYTRARIQDDTRRIIALYQSKGFYNVRVNPQLINLGANRVNIAFVINENGKTQIEDIVFVGNKSISSDRLRSAMVTKQKAWWNPFGNNTTYDPDRLQYDKELIRRFYLKDGFADVQVTNAEAHLKPDGKTFQITITIDEGPRYSIADVAVNTGTATTLDGKALKRKVRTGVGDMYDASKVDSTVDALTLEASNQGFTFAKVEPKVDRNPDGRTVNITYFITDGPRQYVERIDITGNTRTRDYVIRRELQLFEGDAFNRTLIERARRRLTALNFFESIDFREAPGSAPDKILLDVHVVEKSTGSVTFSVGYSSVETIVGSIEYGERNMFGMGLQQNITTSVSFVRQSLAYGFTDPYFLGLPLSAGFDIFANNTDNQSSSSYTSTQYGGDVRTGFRLDEYQSVNLKVGEMYRFISGSDPTIATPTVLAQQGGTYKTSAGIGYVYDNLDSPVLPTSGLRAQLNLDAAGLFGDAQWLKAEGKLFYFVPLFDSQVVVKFEGTGGHIQSFGNNVNVQDRFFKGSDSFRGFAPGGVGPVQKGNNGAFQSIGGDDYAIGTVEANFPLGLPEALGISGAVFTDFGTLFNSGGMDPVVGGANCTSGSPCGIDDAAYFRLSAGAGLVWQSPFGPLRLDWSYPIIKGPNDAVQYWRFSLGTRF